MAQNFRNNLQRNVGTSEVLLVDGGDFDEPSKDGFALGLAPSESLESLEKFNTRLAVGCDEVLFFLGVIFLV